MQVMINLVSFLRGLNGKPKGENTLLGKVLNYANAYAKAIPLLCTSDVI